MLKQAILVFALGFSNLALATEQVIREDTTPPNAEGALTVDQIPPIESVPTPKTTQPAAPQQ